MKALWRHELYVALDTEGDMIELARLDGDERQMVSLADPSLIIEPTDGEIDEAEALLNYRGHCCDCPHVTYMTVNVATHQHECHVCGETFTDPYRTKIYIHWKSR